MNFLKIFNKKLCKESLFDCENRLVGIFSNLRSHSRFIDKPAGTFGPLSRGMRRGTVYSASTDLADQNHGYHRVRAIECVPPRSRVHGVYTETIHTFIQRCRSDGVSIKRLRIYCKGYIVARSVKGHYRY